MSAVVNNLPPYSSSPEVEEEETDLLELIGIVIENRWLIISIAVLALFIGSAYALISTPIYQADALLQVEEKSSGLSDLEATAIFDTYTPITAEIEILRSRSVVGTVVDDLKLDIIARPEHFPIFGAAFARLASPDERPQIKVDSFDVPKSLLGTPFKLVAINSASYEVLNAGGETVLQGSVGTRATEEDISLFVSKLRAEPGQEFLVMRQPRIGAIQSLQQRLSVSEKGDWSGILSVRVVGEDPDSVRRQVDAIANAYLRQNVERKSAEAEKTLVFLGEQLPIVKQNMEAAEAALNNYRLEKGSIDLPLETQTILQTIVSVESELNKLGQERDKALQSFTPAHPIVLALDRQIGRLGDELEQLNAQVRELPNTQQEVLRLVRDAEVNTVLYTSLLNTAQELRVVKAGTVGNVRVLDYAITASKPIKPNKGKIRLLYLLFGLAVGVGIAFLRRALMGGVVDPNLIEKHVNVPVYATIAHSKRQERLYKKVKSKEVPTESLH